MAERAHPLVEALAAAVPMVYADLDTWPVDVRDSVLAAWRAAAPDLLAAKSDVLLYGAGSGATQAAQREVRQVFTTLVRSIVVLAHAPGGVEFAGQLYCARHARYGIRGRWPCPHCAEIAAEVARHG